MEPGTLSGEYHDLVLGGLRWSASTAANPMGGDLLSSPSLILCYL